MEFIVIFGVFIPLLIGLIGIITENSFKQSIIIGIKFGWGILLVIFISYSTYILLSTLIK